MQHAIVTNEQKIRSQAKDLFFIAFGILLYSFGYTAFILPEKVVMGGVAGISALGYYALSWAVTLLVALLGVMIFNKVERTFMDTV